MISASQLSPPNACACIESKKKEVHTEAVIEHGIEGKAPTVKTGIMIIIVLQHQPT